MKERRMNPQGEQEGAEEPGTEGTEEQQQGGEEQQESGEEEQEQTPYEKALSVEREARKALEAQLKAMQAEREQEKEAARLAAMDENARAIEEAKAAVRAEMQAEFDAQMLTLKAQARATNFHDPALAVSLAQIPAGASDEDIDAALAALAKEKPYLAKAAGGVPPAPQGPRGGGSGQTGSMEDFIRQAVAAKNG